MYMYMSSYIVLIQYMCVHVAVKKVSILAKQLFRFSLSPLPQFVIDHSACSPIASMPLCFKSRWLSASMIYMYMYTCSYIMHEYQGQAFADASDLPRVNACEHMCTQHVRSTCKTRVVQVLNAHASRVYI